MLSKCPDCGNDLIDFYDPADDRIEHCIKLCRNCDFLWIGDKKVLANVNKNKNIIEEAKKKINEELERAASDNEFRARKYFERVFYFAFSEGFLRALAYYQHKYKDGRLKRLRDLWNKTKIESYGTRHTIEGITVKELLEIQTLINLGRSSSREQHKEPNSKISKES